MRVRVPPATTPDRLRSAEPPEPPAAHRMRETREGAAMDYRRHYVALIDRARYRELHGYTEKHHVLPRCLGGGDEPQNIVRLTPEEHFVAHQLLMRMHPDNGKLVFAALAMTRGRPSNRRYGWLRRNFSLRMSEVWLGKKRPPFTEEHRRNIGEASANRVHGPQTEEHKDRLSAAHKGKRLTAEHRQKLAEAKLGTKREPYKQSTCPHCAKAGAGGTMKRWHFDNCRGQ